MTPACGEMGLNQGDKQERREKGVMGIGVLYTRNGRERDEEGEGVMKG